MILSAPEDRWRSRAEKVETVIRRPILALSLVALSLPSMTGCSKPPPQAACMAGLTRALTEGDFSGPILCSDSDASFALAGRAAGYAIYDYRYRYRPLHAAVDHGGQRILIFRDGVYLGQYTASPPPYVTVSVQGSEVGFTSPDTRESSSLDLSHGPPPDALISGQATSFFR
jgi:hypothetical protein